MPRRKAKRKTAPAAGSHKTFSRRLTVLAVLFTLVCATYGGILVSLQGGAVSTVLWHGGEDAELTRTVPVRATRGEIFDRNGTPLVTNAYFYDLRLTYEKFAGAAGARNELLLAALALTDRLDPALSPDATRPQDLFPLEGVYPRLSYSEAALDPESEVAAALAATAARLGMNELPTAASLVSFYVTRCGLDAVTDGIPCYSGEEITRLLRVLYDMDRVGFGEETPYTFLSDVGTAFVSAEGGTLPRGLEFFVRAERVYHYPGYAAHLLGRVSATALTAYHPLGYPMEAVTGTAGCERGFEEILRGTDGEMTLTYDQAGHLVGREITKAPVDGADLRLTIDIDLEIAAEDALRELAAPGAFAALDPDTGALLAMASAPSYSQDHFATFYETLSRDPAKPLSDRATASLWLPGGVQYLFTAVAALEEGVLQYDTMLTDGGTLTVGDRTLPCPAGGHADATIDVALRDGCPVFFGEVGRLLGTAKLGKWLSAFGFGQTTGILPGELGGLVSLGGGQDAAVAAAVGLPDTGVTTLQLASALSAVETAGTRKLPYLLLETRSPTGGDVLSRTRAQVAGEAELSAGTTALITSVMRELADDAGVYSDALSRGCDVGLYTAENGSGTVALAFGERAGTSVCVAVTLDGNADPSDIIRALLP